MIRLDLVPWLETTTVVGMDQTRSRCGHPTPMAKSKLALASFPAGHVSRAMLSRYSHMRMEAKRRALDEIAVRQCAADEKRKEEVERQQQAAVVAPLAVVQ
jgi:hypothetical protein